MIKEKNSPDKNIILLSSSFRPYLQAKVGGNGSTSWQLVMTPWCWLPVPLWWNMPLMTPEKGHRSTSVSSVVDSGSLALMEQHWCGIQTCV
jgi:hypothetical protein